MTHPVESIEHAIGLDVVKVHVVASDVPEKKPERTTSAADFGAWATFQTPAGPDQARRILSNNRKRTRAVLLCSAGLAGNVAGAVFLGTQAQAQTTQAGLSGGRLIAGQSITIESYSDLWLVGDGTNSLTVTVMDEQNR